MPSDTDWQLEHSYRQLPGVFFVQVAPEPVKNPKVLVFNDALAAELGLPAIPDQEKTGVFSGNNLVSGTHPLAQAYAGHQFGHFTMLGDGRAHLLGEQVTPDGRRFDIQLKGSGRTPFSRNGDGRAVLGPMLREYLIAEAVHALGIPTTRSLAVVSTGELVQRETQLPGAILTRVASSHIRVGTFQFAAATGNREALQALLDYTIRRHDPELIEAGNRALALLDAAIDRQTDLITHWMRVGFIHGVMNTDNIALSGETIDYGPCAFMDAYDPATVFSSIDVHGRYAYGQQPAIAAWNLARLAEALLPLIDTDQGKAIEIAEERVNGFADIYRNKWLAMMRSKLGLFGEEEADTELITGLLAWMKKNNADYTNTFRDLGSLPTTAPRMNAGPAVRDDTGPAFTCGAQLDKAFADWYTRWQDRIQRNGKPIGDAVALMRRTNPAVIPRNHKVEEALSAATGGDMMPFNTLHTALQNPYEEHEQLTPYQSPPEPSDRVYQTFCGT